MANKKDFDVFPQAFRIGVVESASNTDTEAEFVTPVQRGSKPGSILAMEIHWIDWFVTVGAMSNGDKVFAHIADRSHPSVGKPSTQGLLDVMGRESITAGDAGNNTVRTDFQKVKKTGDGRGVLYTKKSMFIAILGASQTSPQEAHAAVYYTMVEVEMGEAIFDAE